MGRTYLDHSSLMPDNPQMRTFSQTTLTIRTDGQTDGRTDKNRQMIAVTLRLRFAARVNNIIMDIMVNVNVRIRTTTYQIYCKYTVGRFHIICIVTTKDL